MEDPLVVQRLVSNVIEAVGAANPPGIASEVSDDKIPFRRIIRLSNSKTTNRGAVDRLVQELEAIFVNRVMRQSATEKMAQYRERVEDLQRELGSRHPGYSFTRFIQMLFLNGLRDDMFERGFHEEMRRKVSQVIQDTQPSRSSSRSSATTTAAAAQARSDESGATAALRYEASQLNLFRSDPELLSKGDLAERSRVYYEDSDLPHPDDQYVNEMFQRENHRRVVHVSNARAVAARQTQAFMERAKGMLLRKELSEVFLVELNELATCFRGETRAEGVAGLRARVDALGRNLQARYSRYTFDYILREVFVKALRRVRVRKFLKAHAELRDLKYDETCVAASWFERLAEFDVDGDVWRRSLHKNYLPVLLNGLHVLAVIDTNAEHSVLSADIVARLGHESARHENTVKNGPGLDGVHSGYAGKVYVDLKVGTRTFANAAFYYKEARSTNVAVIGLNVVGGLKQLIMNFSGGATIRIPAAKLGVTEQGEVTHTRTIPTEMYGLRDEHGLLKRGVCQGAVVDTTSAYNVIDNRSVNRLMRKGQGNVKVAQLPTPHDELRPGGSKGVRSFHGCQVVTRVGNEEFAPMWFTIRGIDDSGAEVNHPKYTYNRAVSKQALARHVSRQKEKFTEGFLRERGALVGQEPSGYQRALNRYLANKAKVKLMEPERGTTYLNADHDDDELVELGSGSGGVMRFGAPFLDKFDQVIFNFQGPSGQEGSLNVQMAKMPCLRKLY